MNAPKTIGAWNAFTQSLPKIHHCTKLMRLNFDFDLGPQYEKRDYDEILRHTDRCLSALDAIQKEVE